MLKKFGEKQSISLRFYELSQRFGILEDHYVIFPGNLFFTRFINAISARDEVRLESLLVFIKGSSPDELVRTNHFVGPFGESKWETYSRTVQVQKTGRFITPRVWRTNGLFGHKEASNA